VRLVVPFPPGGINLKTAVGSMCDASKVVLFAR